MQFSTSIQDNTSKQTWWERFTSQPHQLFFTSAIFFAIFIMVLTLFSLLGKINLDFALIHGFGLNYGLFTNAFLGFLITVMPKYNSSIVIKRDKYLQAWIIYQVGIFCSLFLSIVIGKILVSLVMFYFVKLFHNSIKEGKALVKTDSKYINLILFIGASLLFIEAITFYNLSTLIFFAYLLSMVFIIALRMIPAFYFAYTKITPWQRPEYIRPISFILLSITGISMQFQFDFILKIISFTSLLFFGFVIYKLNLFKKTPPLISVLVVGLIWFEIAYISLFIESIVTAYSFKLSFHIFAIGFVTTLLIGFGSRVVMGHAVPPQAMVADKITLSLFFLTQIVLISRVIVSISFIAHLDIFTIFLHLSSTLWIVMFIIWTIRYGKTLIRIKS
ncbi:NnrS family protein [Halarcobacter sp.]|uniref:NnrS family protein n=1 Tax=Halarcobacter sp. TaxID=2321133 RepID=UPI002AAC2852|nr:NnrS family protein [Halarcobacter sp.]